MRARPTGRPRRRGRRGRPPASSDQDDDPQPRGSGKDPPQCGVHQVVTPCGRGDLGGARPRAGCNDSKHAVGDDALGASSTAGCSSSCVRYCRSAATPALPAARARAPRRRRASRTRGCGSGRCTSRPASRCTIASPTCSCCDLVEGLAVGRAVRGDREVADLARHLRAGVVADADGVERVRARRRPPAIGNCVVRAEARDVHRRRRSRRRPAAAG